jgi:hypothetical protein
VVHDIERDPPIPIVPVDGGKGERFMHARHSKLVAV